MLARLLSYAKQAAGAVTFLFIAGFGCETESSLPRYARVYVNPATGTYLSPPSIELTRSQELAMANELPRATSMRDSTAALARIAGLLPTVSQDVHEQNLRADPRCRNLGGFIMQRRSLSGELLEKVAILPKLPSRWNRDGSWNY